MNSSPWVALLALVVALVALTLGLLSYRAVRRRPRQESRPSDTERPHRGMVAVIVNPATNVDVTRLRAVVERVADDAGYAAVTWLETTTAQPGADQAHEALRNGASLIVTAGGDGTVRAVAGAMAGSPTPMAILPLGTGNLLARNLDLPLLSLREMTITALGGQERSIDLGWLRIEEPLSSDEDPPTFRDEGPPGSTEHSPITDPIDSPATPADAAHPFLVIGGMGFDAAMVESADTDLKARIGWVAYFVAGIKHLTGRKIQATIQLDDAEPTRPFMARTVLVANCGRLPGGVVLLPDAEFDDGWLDIAAIDTRGGIIGWADLLRRVVLQGLGIRRDLLPYRRSTLEFSRSRQVTVRTEQPEQVQLDGDLLGDARAVHAWIQPAALLLRTP